MINDQLLRYIRHQLSLSATTETISNNLKSQGWTDEDLAEAFHAIGPAAGAPAPVSAAAPQSSPVSSPMPSMTPNAVPLQAQAAQPVFSTLPPATMFPPVDSFKPAHKNRKVVSLVLALILIIIAGGGAYAYYSGAFVSLSSLTSGAMDKARSVTSVKYDVTLNVDIAEAEDVVAGLMPILGSSATKFRLTVTGATDMADTENPKNSSVISLNLGSISSQAEMRLVENMFYAKLAKAPAFGILPIPMVSSYENKWFSVPYNKSTPGVLSNPFSAPSDLSDDEKITPAQKERLYQIAKSARLIRQTAKLSSEEIGGESSHHFGFDLDREGIISYLDSLKEYVNQVGKNDSELSVFDPTDFGEELDKIKDFQGEIWIGKNDKLVHKITASFAVLSDPAKDEKIKLNLAAIFSDYNQPVSIVAPKDSVPFDTFFSGIMEESLSTSQQKGREAAIKASMSMIRAEAELFWSDLNGYSDFCLSKRLKDLRTNIEGSGGSGFVCRATKDAFAAGVKFSGSPGSNWCTDSTGANKATATLPSGTVCPSK